MPYETAQTVVSKIREDFKASLSETVENDIAKLYTMPLTFLTEENVDGTYSSFVHTIYFLTPENNRFQFQVFKTIPVPTDDQDERIWREIRPSQKMFLSNSANKLAISENDFSCIRTEESSLIPICFMNEYPNEALDVCSESIFKNHQVLNNCPYEERVNAFPTAIQKDKNQWIYSTSKLSAIREKCSTSKEIVTKVLPETGILTLNELCSYQMINGPFKNLLPFIFGSKYEATVGDVLPKVPKTAHPIKEHFKNHAYIYLLAILGILFLILTGFVMIFIIHKKRQRRSATSSEQSRSLNVQAEDEIRQAAAQIFLREFARLSGRPRLNNARGPQIVEV